MEGEKNLEGQLQRSEMEEVVALKIICEITVDA